MSVATQRINDDHTGRVPVWAAAVRDPADVEAIPMVVEPGGPIEAAQ